MKHSPMGINRSLYSLKIVNLRETQEIVSLKETQKILWLFSRIAIYKTNVLIVSWEQFAITL